MATHISSSVEVVSCGCRGSGKSRVTPPGARPRTAPPPARALAAASASSSPTEVAGEALRVPGLLDGVGQLVGEQLVADSGLRIERPGRKVHRAVLSDGAGAPRLSTLDGRGVGMDAELTEVGSQTPLHVRAQPVVQPLAAGPT